MHLAVARSAAVIGWLCLSTCGGPSASPIDPPQPRGAYDPTSGCQRALSHVVALSVKAVGEGPTNAQRGEVLRRCIAVGSDRGSDCVLRLRRLAGKRGGAVRLGVVWACLR